MRKEIELKPLDAIIAKKIQKEQNLTQDFDPWSKDFATAKQIHLKSKAL